MTDKMIFEILKEIFIQWVKATKPELEEEMTEIINNMKPAGYLAAFIAGLEYEASKCSDEMRDDLNAGFEEFQLFYHNNPDNVKVMSWLIVSKNSILSAVSSALLTPEFDSKTDVASCMGELTFWLSSFNVVNLPIHLNPSGTPFIWSYFLDNGKYVCDIILTEPPTWKFQKVARSLGYKWPKHPDEDSIPVVRQSFQLLCGIAS